MAKTDKRRKAVRLPEQVQHALRAAEDKKATDLVVLDLRKAAGFTDFFVISSGTNPRQIRAIADSVMVSMFEVMSGSARESFPARSVIASSTCWRDS